MESMKTQYASLEFLLCVLSPGVRLYFTTSQFNAPFSGPAMLTLVHVRLPPGFSAGSTQPPSKVHAAYHGSGTLLLMASQNEDHDLLWAVSNDSFPFQKQLMETQVNDDDDNDSSGIQTCLLYENYKKKLRILGQITPIRKWNQNTKL